MLPTLGVRGMEYRGGRVAFRSTLAAVVVLFCLSGLAALGQDTVSLVGSGSSLPLGLYEAWVSAFNQRNPNIKVRYLPLGTVVSIEQTAKGSGDFGAGEVPLSDSPIHVSQKLVSVPVALVAVVPVYNLSGVRELRFSGKLLADIYLGKVRNWNDPAIAQLNAGIKLPGMPIEVIHRAAGKGANFIFSDFLSKQSSAFRQQIGRSASPKWVVGRSAMRNQDMLELVANTPGAIGYAELSSRPRGVSVGKVQNAAGRFVDASSESITNACSAALHNGTHSLELSLTDAPGENAYPMSSFTYVYLPTGLADRGRANAMKSFLEFMLSDGQEIAEKANYAALPAPVLEKARARLLALK